MTLGHDVTTPTFFGGCGQRRRNRHVVYDLSHDTVDWRVHAQSLTDDGVKDGKIFKRFKCQWVELSIFSGAEVSNLLLV